MIKKERERWMYNEITNPTKMLWKTSSKKGGEENMGLEEDSKTFCNDRIE